MKLTGTQKALLAGLETAKAVLNEATKDYWKNIKLPPELWDRLDALRGELTRSAWIAAKIKNARL